jgi:hypothetical protein
VRRRQSCFHLPFALTVQLAVLLLSQSTDLLLLFESLESLLLLQSLLLLRLSMPLSLRFQLRLLLFHLYLLLLHLHLLLALPVARAPSTAAAPRRCGTERVVRPRADDRWLSLLSADFTPRPTRMPPAQRG